MVHGCHDSSRSTHAESAPPQPFKGLRRSDLMKQMQIDINYGRTIRLASYDVGFPNFFKQCLWFHILALCNHSCEAANISSAAALNTNIIVITNTSTRQVKWERE